jgi:hypothetical protein
VRCDEGGCADDDASHVVRFDPERGVDPDWACESGGYGSGHCVQTLGACFNSHITRCGGLDSVGVLVVGGCPARDVEFSCPAPDGTSVTQRLHVPAGDDCAPGTACAHIDTGFLCDPVWNAGRDTHKRPVLTTDAGTCRMYDWHAPATYDDE